MSGAKAGRAFLALVLASLLPRERARAGVTIAYAGYVGGSADESTGDVAVDAQGSAYIGGSTATTDGSFPVAVGPWLSQAGGVEAFVTKLRPDGTGLLYSGYIGAEGNDSIAAITVDAAGSAYVFGLTSGNTGLSFPVLVGPDLVANGGPYDGWVAKLRPDGTALLYCGYVGGSGNEETGSIAIDAAGAAYLSGDTQSTQLTFPVAVGPDLTYNDAGTDSDAWAAKVRPDGSGLAYAGYIGGETHDDALGIAVDSSGSAYLAGQTSSTRGFTIVGPDVTANGDADAFAVKVRADGTGLVYAGYIGGSGDDFGFGIDVDGSGRSFISGSTRTTDGTFPVAVGPDLTFSGSSDAFLAKVRTDGSGLVHSGFIGGDGGEVSLEVAVDPAGTAHIAGWTTSTEATFPVLGGPDATLGGAIDGFVAAVASDGRSLLHSGYIGGAGPDRAIGIALDAAGDIYLSGVSESTEATFPVQVGPDLTHNGGRDAYVVKLTPAGCLVAPAEIADLLLVRAGATRDDVAMSWQADLGANGYNVWTVERKEDIPDARQATQPPAVGVLGCAAPMPAGSPTCNDQGGVSRAPALRFYQVRAFCDALSEGP